MQPISLAFSLYQWVLGGVNWEISVILIFNLIFPAISHPFIPIENSLSGAVLPCPSFVQSRGLSRDLKNRLRVQRETAWSRKGFVLKGKAQVPSLRSCDASVSQHKQCLDHEPVLLRRKWVQFRKWMKAIRQKCGILFHLRHKETKFPWLLSQFLRCF